ncbi:MAG TPA: AsmA family protein [Terriglobales bacterium]|nr:AsmA family protein [Terriglobales bacterium]
MGIALLVLLALFLVRPRFGLLHRRVQSSLSTELGRAVEMSSVHVRFLPRPGLEIEDLVIHDGADFGAEPLLRSSDVIAYLRVSALFRRRFEISGLSLADASLNLSRDLQGKWNIEELLERASRSSTAPTGSNRKEPRREFPYIEAGQARINFKNGLEKTHFALTNAQFSLWQESENQWGMRLQARPIRTDANLTDTGVISLSGNWARSAVLANTPVRFSFAWKQAQLGQLSKLFSGNDKGWRGNVLLSASIVGTLGNSSIIADTVIDQLRRQDILIGGDLRVVAHCAADYNSAQASLTNLDCGTPAGDGSLELKGTAVGIPFSSYDLTLVAKDASAQSALDFARRINPNIPQDSRALGSFNFALSANRNGRELPKLAGAGEALGVRLTSASSGTELQLGTVPLRLIIPSPSKRLPDSAAAPELQAGPINVGLGRPAPVVAQVSISRVGYVGFIRGDATLKRLQPAANVLRIAMSPISADGNVTLNLAISHRWGETTPVITGTAQLHSVHAEVHGLNSPLQIHRADLSISPELINLTNLDANVRDAEWHGVFSVRRPCASPDSCFFEFRLHSPQVSAASLNQLVNPAATKRPWYRILGLGSNNSFFAKATGAGSVTIDKLILGGTVCNHFSADLGLDKAKLSLAKIHGNILGGKATGSFTADFSTRPPEYSGSGAFESVSLATVATLMHTDWAEGSASASYDFKTAGWSLSELLNSAELKSEFHIAEGVFPHVVLAEGDEPLRAPVFSGDLLLHEGAFSFAKTELKNDDGVYALSGTVSLAGALNLKMTSENSSGYNIAGTLNQTRVSALPNPATQAELKP